MQTMINAANNDLFDVLALMAYACSPSPVRSALRMHAFTSIPNARASSSSS
jgi:hypothetical protein